MSERPNQKKRTAKKSAKARATDRRDAGEPASAERRRTADDAREEGWRRYFARVGAEIREASERWRAEGLLVEFPDEEARLARLHHPYQRPINPEHYKEAQRLQFAELVEHLRERGKWPP